MPGGAVQVNVPLPPSVTPACALVLGSVRQFTAVAVEAVIFTRAPVIHPPVQVCPVALSRTCWGDFLASKRPAPATPLLTRTLSMVPWRPEHVAPGRELGGGGGGGGKPGNTEFTKLWTSAVSARYPVPVVQAVS